MRSRLTLALAFAAALLAGRVARAEEADAAARRALLEGDEQRESHNCERAIDAWRSGLAIRPHWVFLLRIGDCYQRGGEHLLALTYLRAGIAAAGDDLTARDLELLQQSIDRSLAQLPALLEVSTDVSGAQITLDGEPLGRSPVAAREVAPGDHVVAANRPGAPPVSERISARRGETAAVALVLTTDSDDVVVPDAAADARDDAVDRSPRRRRRHLLWGGLMLGAGLILGGGGAALVALDGQEFEDERAVALDTMGPGMLLLAVGVGLVVGGGVLFSLPPSTGEEEN